MWKLLAMVMHEAIRVLVTGVAKVGLALVAIPRCVVPLLISFVPAVPASATNRFARGLIQSLHREVE